jgi:ankyrin repeat protein
MIKDIIHTCLQLFSGKYRSQELLKAIRQGETSKAVEMIKSGVDVRVASANKTTALMMSSTHNYNELFDAILNSPTVDMNYLNAKDNSGDSVIHYAATFRNLDLIKKIVAKGVDIDCKNNFGKTALIIVCDNQSSIDKEETLALARELVALKANINAQDNELNSPLIRAAVGDNAELVKFLLSEGANPRLKNSSGYSAFRHSLEKANKDMAISLILSLNNSQEIEANYSQSLIESTAYPEIKPTLDILKNKIHLEHIVPEKADKKEKSRKI